MAFAMSIFLPVGRGWAGADRHQAVAMLTGTTKPLIVVTYELDGLRDVAGDGRGVAGGTRAAASAVGGLVHQRHARSAARRSLGRLLFLAERGLPALWIP